MHYNHYGFEDHILRQKITTRGGGIEIDLTAYGFPGEKMAAYQNYLGGGVLGKVSVNDTVRARNVFVEESMASKLDEIGEALKQYFHALTNPEDGWESQSYEQNQNMPVSGY